MTSTTATQRGIFASVATIRTLTKLLVGSVALMFAMTATATKIVWTFDNATFLDSISPVLQGGAASGSFTFDTVTQTYSDINIATSTSNGPLNTYDNAVSTLEENASNLAVVSSASPPSPGPGEIGGPPRMLFLWQTPLSDVIPLTRSFQSGTPGGTNALGLECQGRSASDNCLEFRQLAIGGTLTGVVVAPVLSFPVAGIIDGSNSYSTTVDGITMTIDKPSPGSLSLFNGNLSFGDVSSVIPVVTLLSFDVSFDSRVY